MKQIQMVDNWFQTVNKVIDLCATIIAVIDADNNDIVHFKACCTSNMQNATLKHLLCMHGPNLGLLIKWIDSDMETVKQRITPNSYDLLDVNALSEHNELWTGYLENYETQKKSLLLPLKMSCQEIINRYTVLKNKFVEAHTQIDMEYSSYSDYSASDTSSVNSEEEEDDTEGEVVELAQKGRRYFRRKR